MNFGGTKSLAVLVSGTGTNLEAILEAGLPVRLVVADRPCRGFDVASKAGVKTRLLKRNDFGYLAQENWDREGYTRAITKILDDNKIDLVAMAGFMTILSPDIFIAYHNRILNTHPALLPDFKGANAVAQTLAAGAHEGGCTVHIATKELDSGRILAQARVPVLEGDTEETLQERIKVVERRLYPLTINTYLNEGSY